MMGNGDQLDCKNRSGQLAWGKAVFEKRNSDGKQRYLEQYAERVERLQGEPFGSCWNRLGEGMRVQTRATIKGLEWRDGPEPDSLTAIP